jgi:hypothetical protein
MQNGIDSAAKLSVARRSELIENSPY